MNLRRALEAADLHRLLLAREIGKPQHRPRLCFIGKRCDFSRSAAFRFNMLCAAGAPQSRKDVIDGIDRRIPAIETRLHVIGLAVDKALRPGHRPQRNRIKPALRRRGHKAEIPGGREQAALPRIHVGQADAAIVGIGRYLRPIGIVAAGNAGWPHVIGRRADHGARRGDDPRQGFKRFHDREVVGRMHDGACRMGDEIKHALGRGLAVQFGEIGEHAAAQRHAGKCLARRRRHLFIGRPPGPRRIGLEGFEIMHLRDHDRIRLEAGRAQRAGNGVNFFRQPAPLPAERFPASPECRCAPSSARKRRCRFRLALLAAIDLANQLAPASPRRSGRPCRAHAALPPSERRRRWTASVPWPCPASRKSRRPTFDDVFAVRLAREGKRDRLGEGLALLQRIGPGIKQRAAHRSCRRHPSSCGGPPSRTCCPPSAPSP